MDIKAIMCDLDGTLLTSNGTVSTNTITAIRKAKEKGILFGLSTGRDAHSVKNLLDEWGIHELVDAIVGTGGGELCDFTLCKEESCYPLSGEFMKEIIKHYEDLDVNFVIPWQGILYAPWEDDHIRKLSDADHIPYKIVDFSHFLEKSRPKLMITCAPQTMESVIARSATFSNTSYKSAALVTASILFEYTDPCITKTMGLKKLLSWHWWDMENLCAFGDEDNDYDMILHAGIGVVMKNGSALTKSAADFITDDNDHDGIGKFINHCILK